MKRVLLRALALVALLALGLALAFRLSPWPAAFLINRSFAGGEAGLDSALEKHVPAGVVSRLDLAYGDGEDERLDVHFPGGTTGRLPTIVWVHGGGWIAGSKDVVSTYLRILAARGYTTVAVEYSTGRGGRYPKPVEQVNAALAWLAAHADELHADPEFIVLGGDSAGAQIAAQLALAVTDATYATRLGVSPALPPERLRAMLLLSGAFTLEGLDFEGAYGRFLRTVLWAYSGRRDFLADERFRLLSITPHATAAFPPSFISSGSGDPLVRQAVDLAARLGELGVPVDTHFFPPDQAAATPHEYQFSLDTPQGREALRRILAFLEGITVSGRQPSGPA